jgi:hypothetical protein
MEERGILVWNLLQSGNREGNIREFMAAFWAEKFSGINKLKLYLYTLINKLRLKLKIKKVKPHWGRKRRKRNT